MAQSAAALVHALMDAQSCTSRTQTSIHMLSSAVRWVLFLLRTLWDSYEFSLNYIHMNISGRWLMSGNKLNVSEIHERITYMKVCRVQLITVN